MNHVQVLVTHVLPFSLWNGLFIFMMYYLILVIIIIIIRRMGSGDSKCFVPASRLLAALSQRISFSDGV